MLLLDKARTDLELPRLWEVFAQACRTPMGARALRGLELPAAHEESLARLSRGREALDLEQRGEPLPSSRCEDVGEALGRLRAAGALSGQELLALMEVLSQARAVRRFLATRGERAPALALHLSSDPTLDALHDEVRAAFDPDGLLSDHASPRLRELRGEVRTLRTRMQSRLAELGQRYGAILQDDFVTEREGRLVLPVRADAHERFPGIVHATSSSGATLFVEPRALIPMGNRLKVLEGEIAREELAIYTSLSAQCLDRLPEVEHAVTVVAEADTLAAVARVAAEHRLRYPELSEHAELELRSARHPLLWLERIKIDGVPQGPEIVPSDLAVKSGGAVIVSGPNAGGKTVALKTLGLCAAAVRAGLPIPCADGSKVGLFDAVLTDIGDDQSLQKNLSTFSAHVQNLVVLLDAASPRALVLLDELATGTDPREGEALAAGVLASLCARGAAVVCTTHYEGLKALALGDPRFVNASVGFDVATLRPTFKLLLGVPGSSSALSVAKQFGMPGPVLERAQAFLSQDDRTAAELIDKLHAERQGLEQARLDHEAKAILAEQQRAALEDERQRLTAREVAAAHKELANLREALRRAHQVLAGARQALRQAPKDPKQLRQIERELDRAQEQVGIAAQPLEAPAKVDSVPIEAGALRAGLKLWSSRLRKEVTVLELGSSGVLIAAGALKLTVPASDLGRRVEPQARGGKGERGPMKAGRGEAPARAPEVAIQTSSNTCDLRGLRVDDALSMTAAFLDRAFGQGERVVFLVHGHGTGALRDALRTELSAHQQVTSFRAGGPGEGGDGATLAWLE